MVCLCMTISFLLTPSLYFISSGILTCRPVLIFYILLLFFKNF